jgi:hypothetical protein
LQHGGVLPSLVEFFLQRLCPENYETISLEHIRFLSGSLYDTLKKATTVTWVLSSCGIGLLKGTVTYLYPMLSPAN